MFKPLPELPATSSSLRFMELKRATSCLGRPLIQASVRKVKFQHNVKLSFGTSLTFRRIGSVKHMSCLVLDYCWPCKSLKHRSVA